MAALQIDARPALPGAGRMTLLPQSTDATCAVCWRKAVVALRDRNLCGGCGAFMLNGGEDYGPWLD